MWLSCVVDCLIAADISSEIQWLRRLSTTLKIFIQVCVIRTRFCRYCLRIKLIKVINFYE